jgi:hypothetical protein
VSKSGDVYPISEISFDQNKIVYSPEQIILSWASIFLK